MSNPPDRVFSARVRVTYYEEWVVEAKDADEARVKLLNCDTTDTHEMECVDWEISGPVKDEGEP